MQLKLVWDVSTLQLQQKVESLSHQDNELLDITYTKVTHPMHANTP